MIDEKQVILNYKQCVSNIQNACLESGRSVDDITIIGASKTMSLDRIRFVKDNTEISIFGENRVQEICDKFDEQISWHFIGQLQTNKVKYIIDKVDLIHSVDRLSLAEEIDRQAKKHNKIMNVLLEVNIGNEIAKGGIAQENVVSFAKSLESFSNLRVLGLMSVLPNVETDALENFYLHLQQVYDRLKDVKLVNGDIRYLSAGMSNDYQLAIKYGANMIRLGRALFGER